MTVRLILDAIGETAGLITTAGLTAIIVAIFAAIVISARRGR